MRFDQLNEDEMTDAEKEQKEKIVKGMKKNKADLKKRYGDKWEDVMYATATKRAMGESTLNEYSTMPVAQEIIDLLNRGEHVTMNNDSVVGINSEEGVVLVKKGNKTKREKISDKTHHVDAHGAIQKGAATKETWINKMNEKQLNEGVLDGTDDEGFVVRSQLYVLAREAIKLHGMIDDQDMVDAEVQDMILDAMNKINMASQSVEANDLEPEQPDPTMPPMDEAWGMNGGAKSRTQARKVSGSGVDSAHAAAKAAATNKPADERWEKARAEKLAKKNAKKPGGLRALFAADQMSASEFDYKVGDRVLFGDLSGNEVVGTIKNVQDAGDDGISHGYDDYFIVDDEGNEHVVQFEDIYSYADDSEHDLLSVTTEDEDLTESETSREKFYRQHKKFMKKHMDRYSKGAEEIRKRKEEEKKKQQTNEEKHPGWKAKNKTPKTGKNGVHPANKKGGGLVGESAIDTIQQEASDMMKSLKEKAKCKAKK